MDVGSPSDLLDQPATGPLTAELVNPFMSKYKKAIFERALGAEMTHHLGYSPGDDKPAGSANHRNGSSGRTVLSDEGSLRIEVPRDRHGAFEPQIVGKDARRFTGFDDKIIALYSRSLSVQEVQDLLQEMYTVEGRSQRPSATPFL